MHTTVLPFGRALLLDDWGRSLARVAFGFDCPARAVLLKGRVSMIMFGVDLPKSSYKKERDDLSRTAPHELFIRCM